MKDTVKKKVISGLALQVKNNNDRARKLYKDVNKINWKDWVDIIKKTKSCPSCKMPWSLVGKPHIDHIKPLKLGGKNTIKNIQPLCELCNKLKSARVKEFM